MATRVLQVPLRRRNGQICAHAQIDADRADLATRTWSLSKDGYVHSGSGHTRVYLHRAVLGLPSRRLDAREVDHVNGDRLDNRGSNLRIVTRAENSQNLTKCRGRSRYRGVHYDARDRRWRAQVTVAGRCVLSRRFATEIEAAVAADAARREFMPFATPDPALAALASR